MSVGKCAIRSVYAPRDKHTFYVFSGHPMGIYSHYSARNVDFNYIFTPSWTSEINVEFIARIILFISVGEKKRKLNRSNCFESDIQESQNRRKLMCS